MHKISLDVNLDATDEAGIKAEAEAWVAGIANVGQVAVDVINVEGPAGGAATVAFTADYLSLREIVRTYDAGNGEVEWIMADAVEVT